MGASIARKRTRLETRVLRHQLAQGCASSCIMTCFSCAAMVFRYSKRARTFFTKYVPSRVASEVTLLEIPPCQIPMCGVAYSCSYVLLMLLSSSFRVQHCFFFCFFFFNFSGHSLCSEHCSQLEHCVASVFSVYIIILSFSSFFSIYLFPDKDVFKRLNF